MMNEYMGETAGRGTVQLPFPARSMTAEVTGDFTLPDYQPEIKRLLRIGVNLLPPDPRQSGGDLTGTMDYSVLYVGADGGVYCAPLSTEYRLESPAEGHTGGLPSAMGEPTICLCDLSSEVPVGRVVSPRRLNIRCKVKARVKAYGECPLTARGVGEEADPTVETLTQEIPVGRLYRAFSEPLTLGDEVILTPAEGEMRVVCAEGQVLMTEAVPSAGTVTCRGEVTVKLTLCPSGSVEDLLAELAAEGDIVKSPPQLTILQRKIPFTQTVGAEGVTSACSATACGYCTAVTVQAEEGRLHPTVEIVTEIRAQQNETVTCVADLYSTRREGVCRYADYPAEWGLRALNGNFTLSDSLPLSDAGIDPAAHVADVTAAAIPQELTADPARGRCLLTGKCRCQLLLQREEEYSTAEVELPFRYEFDDAGLTIPRLGVPLSPAFDGSVAVVNCRARMDGERIGMDAELAVSIRTHVPSPFTALTDVSLGNEVTRRRGEYVICFPAPTDTVWSVAKRYHAPMAGLTAANNLPAGVKADGKESLEGIQYLIV